ncbi:hypothetical protein [Candidatus Alkanophaga liquidiphilum]|nr:hypothetical protein [Candidatus Alkanophaga liquidiphilum]
MRTITRIFLGLGGLLFIVDGVLKLYNPEFVVPVVNQTLPCGLALLIVGLGILLLATEK